MKNIIIALIASIALPVMASNICSKSWEEVNHSRYAGDFPKIQFNNTWVSVDGLCLAGENLRTIDPIEVCVDVANNDSGSCRQYEKQFLTTPLSYLRPIQIGSGDKFEYVPETHPLDYLIPVGFYGESFTQVCQKQYSIVKCQ